MAEKRGMEFLQDPRLNKSTAFTESEKQRLGLVGLLPDTTESEDLQLQRVMLQLSQKSTDLERLWVSKTRNSVPWAGRGGYCRRKRALENSANRLWRS